MRGPTRNARIAVVGLAVALSGVGWGTRGARGQDLGQQPPQQPPPPPAPHTPTVTKPPALLKTVEAIYPPEALAERLPADVTMLIEIDATGKVTKTEITRPAGHGFDEAAAVAVAQYQFTPAEVDGKPSPIRIEYTLHFVPNVVPDAGTPDAAPPPPPPPPPPPLQVVLASGRLREKGTREPLPAADVAIIVRNADGSDAPAEIVGVTDLDGRFQVKAPAGRALRVVITDAAHDPCIRDLAAGSEAAPTTIDCIVARRPGVGQETVVKAPPPTQAVTRYELKQPELTSVPGTFGDPLRVVQSLPGVARTPYGLGALIIRGASPDDSGIYVEGHPIPILYHFLIGPSVMTPRLIERIDFFPGNFGVQYGRATAGIVDVGLKTDRAPRVHGIADLNLLDSSAYVEGPLGKEWSGSLSARRSYVDLVLKALAPSDTTLVAPAYYDYQASARRNLANGRLSLFAFGSDDTLKVISNDANRGDIQLNTAIGFHKLIAAWVAGLGGWVNKLSPAVGYERVRFTAGAVEVNQSAYVAELRDELSRALTPALIFRVGFDGVMRREHLFFNLPVPPMARLWGETIPMFQERSIPLDSLGAGLYSDVTWDLGRGVTIIPGLRGDLFRVVDQNRFTFDPRLVVRWKMRPTHTWKAGAGIYHQMPQAQLMTPEYGNPNLPPIWADQYSVGFVNNLTRKLTLDTTLYYVRRHDLPVPPPPFTANGQGRSYGMELILKHEFTDRFFGWLSYTLSRSEQTAYAVNTPMLSGPGLQDPNAKPMTWFPTDFDQTHNLIVVGSYKLGAWQLGARFRLVTGAPDTPMREGAFDADTGRYACATAPVNSARKPTFHQLDVRAERLWTFSAWQLGAYVDIQNVLNAENPEATIYDYRCRGTTALRGIPFFPIFGIRGLF